MSSVDSAAALAALPAERARMLDAADSASAASAASPASATPHRPSVTLRRRSSSHAARARRLLRKRLPILNWIGGYNAAWAVSDLIAGVTLGLTIIPESIACALLAGLPAHYGLCSAFVGSFVYLFVGSIDKVIIGPTSLVALVSVQFTMGRPLAFAFLLTFFSGVVQIAMGCLCMGFIFEYISMPVIKAFSSATAVLVIESQLKVLLGVKYVAASFVDSLGQLGAHLHEVSVGDLAMGLSAVVFLVLFEQLERVAKYPKLCPRLMRISCRYLSYARNTLAVVVAATVACVWLTDSPTVPFRLSENALTGLPNFSLPSFTVETPQRTYTLWQILAELNVGIVVVPVIGVLTNISIGKLTPKGLVDANQELLTCGLCNVLGACVQSMPTSGAFTRYAISEACGLRTPMANLYSGAIVLLALSYLSPYFNLIPEATLAAILICSIFTLLDFRLPARLWRESKRDFGIWTLCFVVCILCGVEVGLLVSIVVTALHLLFLWARPGIAVRIAKLDDMPYISVTPGNGIYFPAINHLRAKVLKAAERAAFKVPVVIDCHRITGLDFTAAHGIARLSADLGQSEGDAGALLVLHRLHVDLQKMIGISENLVFCEGEARIREFLTQESLRNGFINLKEHIRASIDLGYQIDVD